MLRDHKSYNKVRYALEIFSIDIHLPTLTMVSIEVYET